MNFWLTLPEIRWQSCLSPGFAPQKNPADVSPPGRVVSI
jgi:hypothetical protein